MIPNGEVVMKKLARYGVAAVLALVGVVAVASDIEFSSEGVMVSDEGVTSYSGNVTIRAPLATAMQVKSNSKHEVNGAQVVEGDVQITLGDTLIKTQKATITRKDVILIEMDQAESVPAPENAG
jgi:lipopolysaccharide export system protein LptA